MRQSGTRDAGGRAPAGSFTTEPDRSTNGDQGLSSRGCVVLVADPELMFAELTAAMLRARPGVDVPLDHPRTKEEMVQAVQDHRPDLVLLEYRLEDAKAPTVVRAILAVAPPTHVVVLSALPPGPHVAESFAAGARGVLAKGDPSDHLIEAVQRVQRGEPPLSSNAIKQLRRRSSHRPHGQPEQRFACLTPREQETLRLIGQGLRVEEVASRLGLSASTVRGYIRGLLSKTGTRSQLEVIALAREHGVIA